MDPANPAALQEAPLAMSPEAFAEAGHQLVDRIAAFLHDLPHMPVTTGEPPSKIRSILGHAPLPLNGTPTHTLIEEAAALLFNHSLFNGHPSFWGYITSSATPIGALADLLAAAVNPNVGAYTLSPMATEIERQTIQWLAEWVGFPAGSSGLFVSGGNMANFVGFLAARRAKAGWDIRQEGFSGWKEFSEADGGKGKEREKGRRPHQPLLIYCSRGTHTWIQKAADLFGLGTNAIRWVDMNRLQQMDVTRLEQQITADLQKGYAPFLVVGTAGSVSTGAVDPLAEIANICQQYNLWFHIDGAYGAPAALLPDYAETFKGLSSADSIAIDPHKWLYSPLEAGCILVRQAQFLTDTFSFHPEYYNFEGDAADPGINYYDYGLQNSRGFRALKVWLGIRQAGRKGYENMIRADIALAQKLFQLVAQQEALQPVSQHLSITTFRYIPIELAAEPVGNEAYLNTLNEQLLNVLQTGGKVFLSNAIVDKMYCLRVCIVNFRTTYAHLEALVTEVLQEGKKLHAQLRMQQKA